MPEGIVLPENDWNCSAHGKGNKWMCEIHGVACCYGTPCYECKRELASPNIIEQHERDRPDIREKNGRPRYKKVISSNV